MNDRVLVLIVLSPTCFTTYLLRFHTGSLHAPRCATTAGAFGWFYLFISHWFRTGWASAAARTRSLHTYYHTYTRTYLQFLGVARRSGISGKGRRAAAGGPRLEKKGPGEALSDECVSVFFFFFFFFFCPLPHPPHYTHTHFPTCPTTHIPTSLHTPLPVHTLHPTGTIFASHLRGSAGSVRSGLDGSPSRLLALPYHGSPASFRYVPTVAPLVSGSCGFVHLSFCAFSRTPASPLSRLPHAHMRCTPRTRITCAASHIAHAYIWFSRRCSHGWFCAARFAARMDGSGQTSRIFFRQVRASHIKHAASSHMDVASRRSALWHRDSAVPRPASVNIVVWFNGTIAPCALRMAHLVSRLGLHTTFLTLPATPLLHHCLTDGEGWTVFGEVAASGTAAWQWRGWRRGSGSTLLDGLWT